MCPFALGLALALVHPPVPCRSHLFLPQGPSGLHQYRLRTVFDEVPLPTNSPVLTNFHEGKAFAAWKTLMEKEVCKANRPGMVNVID